MQITEKWQECSVCLAAEREGDSVTLASQHRRPDPISSHFKSHLVRCQRCRQHVSLLPGARLPPCSRTMDVLSFPELASALALDPSWLAPYVPQQADLCLSLLLPGTWTTQEKFEDVPYPSSVSAWGASVPSPSMASRDALKSVCECLCVCMCRAAEWKEQIFVLCAPVWDIQISLVKSCRSLEIMQRFKKNLLRKM